MSYAPGEVCGLKVHVDLSHDPAEEACVQRLAERVASVVRLVEALEGNQLLTCMHEYADSFTKSVVPEL